jgi:2-phosphoglycerate kinase
MARDRSWDVLLIGGASGVGKTSVSYRIAQHFAVGITEIDDFQVLLEKMTTPAQYPALHFWPNHPAPETLEPEEVFRRGLGIGSELEPGIAAVVKDHLFAHTPVVLEGDFLHPAFLARLQHDAGGRRVQAVIIDEPDEAQIRANFLRREPETPRPEKRARVSWLYAAWLREEANRAGVTVVSSRPWSTAFERVLETLE